MSSMMSEKFSWMKEWMNKFLWSSKQSRRRKKLGGVSERLHGSELPPGLKPRQDPYLLVVFLTLLYYGILMLLSVYKSCFSSEIYQLTWRTEGVEKLNLLWENKLMQSKAVDGFHSEEQQLLLQVQQQQQQQQQQHHHHHHHTQPQPQQTVQQQSQPQQVLIPASQQAQQQVIVPDSKLIPHMNASGMSAAATAATLALPAGVTPVQQILTNSGQILQVVRTANGAQYIIQPQQPVVLQQQVIPQMQPGGVQAPVIQQVLAPIPGGISQQTGVIIQPQQILFTGNKTQVIPTTVAAPTPAQAQIPAAGQQQPQQQAQPQAPLVLQVDGAGDTSSEEEEEDEEEDYDDDEEEDKEKDGGEDGQVEEEPLNSEDDVSDEEGQELFDTENVVVCQYDKIHRSKNKWKFHLKDGIMNLNGRDYVFSKAIGDAEW
ncbi:transcription initiation factor IIA subunit 1 isoform 2-T3 [Amazona ochrocephala]